MQEYLGGSHRAEGTKTQVCYHQTIFSYELPEKNISDAKTDLNYLIILEKKDTLNC